MPQARLAQIELPEFGMPDGSPELPDAIYPTRIERLSSAAGARGYDRVVVYSDREHSANLAYLTGFDPRFEEAMLIVGPSEVPAILVGNECYGMAGSAPAEMRRHRFQDFSLPSQPRDRSRPLAEILRAEGIEPGGRVGAVGWKTYGNPGAVDIPSYIVDELRRAVGPSGTVENATGLLIDFGRWAARDQRGRAAGCLRIRRVSDVAWPSAVVGRPATRDDGTRGGQAPRLERDAPVLPPDVDGWAPGDVRIA